jgi:phosphomannomutase
MARLRSTPPTAIGDVAVTSIDDFLLPASEGGFGDFGSNDILRIWTADGSRIIVRPSGTEPKLKAYIDASSTDGTASERVDAAAAKVAALDAGMRSLLA